jgi:hypothetical protein
VISWIILQWENSPKAPYGDVAIIRIISLMKRFQIYYVVSEESGYLSKVRILVALIGTIQARMRNKFPLLDVIEAKSFLLSLLHGC